MSKSIASASSAAPTRRRTLAGRLGILGATAAVAAVAIAISGTTHRAAAEVVTIDPLGEALGFNAFIEGDTVLTEHEMEGPLATGGDLAMWGIYEIDIHSHASFVDDGDTNPSSLVVGGLIDWAGSATERRVPVLNNSGYVKVGDLTGTEVLNNDQNGAEVSTRLVPTGAGYNSNPRIELTTRQPADSVESSPTDFAAAFAEFRSNAELLAACPNTVAMYDSRENGSPIAKGEVQPGQQAFITLTEGQTNVLNVTGGDLNNMSDLTFVNKPNADTPILINVDTSATGGVFDWNVASQAGIGDTEASYILWNFNGATELTLVGGDTVQGSIYAPDADFTDLSYANVQGQIVAKSAVLGTVADNSGELHYFPFAAELTCDTDVEPSPSPTTEGPTTDGPTTDGSGGESPNGDSAAGDRLPITGSSLLTLGIAAAVLLAAGTTVLILSRRRQAR